MSHAPFIRKCLLCLALLFACVQYVSGEDWPTYMGDAQRSGMARTHLQTPLHIKWIHIPAHEPAPAWPDPAKQDIWHKIREISPAVVYDRAYHVVVSGDRLYFGSSADDQVYCLDTGTGEIRWRFFTEGPVRLAPVIDGDRVYFTSDDGWGYCVAADTGTLIWRYSPADLDRRIPGNGRIISHAPVRTGMLVEDDVAWFFSGLFTPDKVYKCAVNALTGSAIHRSLADTVSPQGYLLASSNRIFVPTGRTAPFMFDRATLDNLGPLQGPGGAFAILVEDAIISGPGRRDGALDYTEKESRESIANFPGIRMLVHEGIAYMQSNEEVSALDRKRYIELSQEINGHNAEVRAMQGRIRELSQSDSAEVARLGAEIAEKGNIVAALEEERGSCVLWKRPAADPFAMIMSGDTLFIGGQDRVYALRAEDGEERWNYPVKGKVYGLAAAGGHLYASSSTGAIYCFGPTPSNQPDPVIVKARTERLADAATDDLAHFLIQDSAISQGYCLVLDEEDAQLAEALAQHSKLHIVLAHRDEAHAIHSRQALAAAGLLGVRVSVHHLSDGALPYTSYLMNLIVSRSSNPGWAGEEVCRLLRPLGGKAYLPLDAANYAEQAFVAMSSEKFASGECESGWLVIERGNVPGAGEWTQLYADASHTSCSDDELQGPMTVQWFGEPGPREMVDRHHRPMSALFRNGRLFITANDKVIAVDGYNGSPLWELDVPASRRVGSMKNSGHQMLIDDTLYIAREGECWVVDATTGVQIGVIHMPLHGQGDKDWGYLNGDESRLIGTGQARGASFDRLALATVHLLEGDFRPVVMSEYLFALDRGTGEELWAFTEGRLLNAMITLDRDRVFVVASQSEAAQSSENGRLRVDHFLADNTRLLALDVNTGATVWERDISLPFAHIAFLNSRDGVLLASGSYNADEKLFYDLYAFDMDTGEPIWHQQFRGMNIRCTDYSDLEGSHGEQWQHPVLTADTVFARPFAFDLRTGARKDYIAYRGGHGCGGLTASAHYLYGRGSVPRMYPTDVESTEGIPLSEVSRPGCWLNIIPAGGIVMIPESSSGCTCAYPLQTSMAFVPAERAGGREPISGKTK